MRRRSPSACGPTTRAPTSTGDRRWPCPGGDLLPADERALVDQWLVQVRSLWEVVSVEATGRARLRDLLRDEQVSVTAAPLVDAAVGELFVAMVVPGATSEHMVGRVAHVPFAARDRALEVLGDGPDGQDIIDLVAEVLGPPVDAGFADRL